MVSELSEFGDERDLKAGREYIIKHSSTKYQSGRKDKPPYHEN